MKCGTHSIWWSHDAVEWSFVARRFFKLSVVRRRREEMDSGGDELDETDCPVIRDRKTDHR